MLRKDFILLTFAFLLMVLPGTIVLASRISDQFMLFLLIPFGLTMLGAIIVLLSELTDEERNRLKATKEINVKT